MTIPEDVKLWRKSQRAALVACRVATAPDQRRQWSELITRSLLDGFPLLHSMVVGCYWPYRGEFDPRHAMRRVRSSGARIALPVVVQKNAPLQFREWWPGAPMVKGVLDLPVPDGTEVLTPHALLIPPVGFDAKGYRLGYGAGYFDRTLAAMNPQPLKIGVGFELSRMPTIHPQPRDVAMDFIVTEAGIHCVDRGRLTLVVESWRALEHAHRLISQRRGTPTGPARSLAQTGR